jgi:hypothetical protein
MHSLVGGSRHIRDVMAFLVDRQPSAEADLVPPDGTRVVPTIRLCHQALDSAPGPLPVCFSRYNQRVPAQQISVGQREEGVSRFCDASKTKPLKRSLRHEESNSKARLTSR